jgi:hypothetical protein
VQPPSVPSVQEPTIALQHVVIISAAGLGLLAIVLAIFSVYFIFRNQGYFYRAKVRATHRSEPEE